VNDTAAARTAGGAPCAKPAQSPKPRRAIIPPLAFSDETPMSADNWWLAISIVGLVVMLGALLFLGFA
jgi:hypothetical protein